MTHIKHTYKDFKMNKNIFDSFTNADLKEYCETEGITVVSKNVSKPTKTEYLEAIQNFESANKEPDVEQNLQQAQIENEDNMTSIDEFLSNNDGIEPIQNQDKNKPSRAEKRRQQYAELMSLPRVLITSNALNQTQTSLHYVTWGNGLLGHMTDRVYLGRPWHVREGALRNLEAAMITEPVQDYDSNSVKFETKPAFNIKRLDPLTKEEIDKIAKRQAIRNASIESLI
jgi:hypothetical protein